MFLRKKGKIIQLYSEPNNKADQTKSRDQVNLTFIGSKTPKTRNRSNGQRQGKIAKIKSRLNTIIDSLTTEEIEKIGEIISVDTLLHKGIIPKRMRQKQIEELRQIEKAYDLLESRYVNIIDRYRRLIRQPGQDHVSTATFEFGYKIELPDAQLQNNGGKLNIHITHSDMRAIINHIAPNVVCETCKWHIKKEVENSEYVEHLDRIPIQRDEGQAVVTCVIHD